MKEITTEFRSKVFALYLPCIAQCQISKRIVVLTAISISEGMVCEETENDDEWGNFEHYKIILKSLSEISHEHLIEVTKIIYKDDFEEKKDDIVHLYQTLNIAEFLKKLDKTTIPFSQLSIRLLHNETF